MLQVFGTEEELDQGVRTLADFLLEKNPEAQRLLKQVFWENCEDWDRLLEQRAEMSGKLVLSKFTKEALKAFT